MLTRLILATIFFLFVSHRTVGQESRVFWNYNISHGLPTNSLYHGFVDSKNRIWFGSDKGVTCFNGISFTTYTVSDGLPDNTVIRCFEDKFGRIWFQHYNHSPSFFKNGKIHKLNTKDRNIIIDPRSNFIELSNGQIIIGAFKGFLVIHPNNEVEFVERHKDKRYVSLYGTKDSIVILHENNDYSKLEFKLLGYKFVGYGNQLIFEIPDGDKFINIATVGRSDGLLKKMVSLSDKDKRQLFKIYPITGKVYHFEEKNGFYFVASEKGLFKFKQTLGEFSMVETLLSGVPVVSVLFDKVGDLWATSSHEGLYFFPRTNYRFTPFPDGKQMLKIKLIEGKLILCGQSNYLLQYTRTGLKSYYKFPPFAINGQISDYTEFRNYYIFVTGNGTFIRDIKKFFVLNEIAGYNLYQNPNYPEEFYSNAYNAISCISVKKEMSFAKILLKDKGKITHIAFLNGKIMAGTHRGVFDVNSGRPIPFYPEKFHNSRINALHVFDNKLVIGTGEKGLFLFENNRLIEFSQKNGLLSNTIYGLYPSKEKNSFWIHTGLGLQKLKITPEGFKEKMRIDVKTPFKIDEINDAIEYNNELLLLLKTGVLALPMNQDFQRKKLPFYVDAFTVENVAQTLNSSSEFRTKSKNIGFNLGIVNHCAHEVNLFYRINKGPWIRNKTTDFNFSSLNPGEYTFEFKATSPFYLPSTISPFTIFIEKEWYQSTWFLILFFVLSLLLFGLFVRWRINKIQSRKRKILSNELLALQSQMNPHFTFNSLNSIQSYLSMNDKRSAQIYLADFAILMRKIMEQAKLNLITLEEEIDFLTQYLNLEKRRLNDSFGFNIEVDKNVIQNQTFIPSLMLQPFVENAVWHGVAALDYPGDIRISFSLQGENLKCEIIDNGLGQNAKKTNNPLHKSTGIKNVKERMHLFEELFNKKMILEIDLENNNTSYGACVRLIIPKLTEDNKLT